MKSEPRYYTEYDSKGKTWCVYVTTIKEGMPEEFVASYGYKDAAETISDVLNMSVKRERERKT